MKIATHGFFRWIIWAMFSWQGRMNRLPYLGASVVSAIPLALVLCLVYWLYAQIVYGPQIVRYMDLEDFLLLLDMDSTPYYMAFPLSYVSIVLAAKRLRAIGLPPYAAIVLQTVYYFTPMEGAASTAMSLIMFVYYLALLLTPTKEEFLAQDMSAERPGAYPGQPGYSGQQGYGGQQGRRQAGVASDNPWPQGTAQPRRRSVHIRDWRLLAPAPCRDDEGK